MMKVFCSAVAMLASASMLSAVSTAPLAQTTPVAQQADRQRPDQQPQDAGEPSESDRRAPVLQVISVEVMRSSHEPILDVVRVRGLASTAGWDDAELVPLTRAPSPDGILDLVFIARGPQEAQDAGGFMPIEAVFPIEPGHPYKGVRIHGAAAQLTLKTFPGYAEATLAQEDCAKCVGKYLVQKGAAALAGHSDAETVKQEQLPLTVRVIKTTEGIPNLGSDPNRLTLLVDEDGRILTAVWD